MRYFVPAKAKESLIIFRYDLSTDSYIWLIIGLPDNFIWLASIEPSWVVSGSMSLRPYIIPARIKLVLGYRLHYRIKINMQFNLASLLTMQEENFHWNLNFANSLMANSPNWNSANYYIFRNLSMIAYIIKIQKSKFADI